MQAKNGSASPRRMRGGMMGCVLVLAFAVTALVLAPAAANARKAAPANRCARNERIIALGDSISFGYTAEIRRTLPDRVADASSKKASPTTH